MTQNHDAPVAVVTGASRGAGKGIARALGAAGMTVYVTGRSQNEGDAPLPARSTRPHARSMRSAAAESRWRATTRTTRR